MLGGFYDIDIPKCTKLQDRSQQAEKSAIKRKVVVFDINRTKITQVWNITRV